MLTICKVNIYTLTDDYDSPIYSFYPVESRGSTGATGRKASSGTKSKDNGVVESSWGSIPPASEIVAEFTARFLNENQCSPSVSLHEISEITASFPKARIYFMDPNACTAQCLHLRDQGKTVCFKQTSMDVIVKEMMNQSRDYECVLLPLSEAIEHATNYGNTSFQGTPIFTTDPMLIKTSKMGPIEEFNPETDVILVFFSPKEAMELYRKCWWKRGNCISTETGQGYYKILGKSAPWTPKIASLSFEKLCSKIYTNEPFWAHLIHFKHPQIPLDTDTRKCQMDQERHDGSVTRGMQYLITRVINIIWGH
ncbi:hypothetical protein BdWA1_000479 [Babesia duncani]|uniref:Uncharacterized protein n=1 Tax=Babesia duncani TaxID=323732 RepID=A0AAD9PMI8_9APIC|nr:hypothetical protein BdWA1_000479 [Babesia duncani]